MCHTRTSLSLHTRYLLCTAGMTRHALPCAQGAQALLTITRLRRRIVAWTGARGVWVGRRSIAGLLRVPVAIRGLSLQTATSV